jgi:CheY-like chemotaxis protein
MDRAPRNPLARPLVLIIEADEGTRAIYALALSAMGFNVVAAQDHAEARRRATVVDPDIIVMDLPRSNPDGWQFLQGLKQNPRTCDIPIVAVSDYAERSLRQRADHHGFAAVFLKPCLPFELAAGLRHVLDQAVHVHVER